MGLMLIANFILIYVPGLIMLGIWIQSVNGTAPGIWNLLFMGFIPFILGDIFKIGGAAALTKAITPKKSFDGEEIGKSRYWIF